MKICKKFNAETEKVKFESLENLKAFLKKIKAKD
jgi:hypothetical protein